MERSPARQIVAILVDANARVGKGRESPGITMEEIMGRGERGWGVLLYVTNKYAV